MTSSLPQRRNVFISCSHKDVKHLRHLQIHLADYERNKLIDLWDDTKISSVANWHDEIEKAIKSAQIAVLLISADFLSSKFIAEDELPQLLTIAKAEGTIILPIILSPCAFEYTGLSKFQTVNPPSMPLTKMTKYQREELWTKVAKIIRETISNVDPILPVREDWGEAPLIENFYGRGQELDELKRWIVDDNCQMVAVLGVGGIGKTVLSAKLMEQIKEDFEYIIWRSLQNAPPLENILKQCIQFLSGHQRLNLQMDLDDLIALFLEQLREHRCLVMLDNVETVLQSGQRVGQYRESYEGYGQLFQRIGTTKHQSCFLLTSREIPREIAILEGNASTVRSLRLTGLNLSEGREILRDRGLRGEEESWNALINNYSGNPLALKIASQYIREIFNGDIASFLTEGEVVFSDIRHVLDHQFARLSALEQEVIYWLAIERESVSLDVIQGNLVRPMSKRELQEALRSLLGRSLIEGNSAGYTLQIVIMEYMTEQIVDRVLDEINTGAIGLFGSHALIKAEAKDYIRISQVRLILLPLAKLITTKLGNEESQKKLNSVFSTLRETRRHYADYAAGNLLNLLIQLGYDLRGYDFSHLVIWQAYLQGVALPEINFANADLSRSIFTDTFGSILTVALQPSGELMAAGTTSGDIRLWQVISGKPLLIYQGHTNWVWSIIFSSDGKLIASGSEDQTVRLWNVDTGRCLKILQGHSDRVSSVAFSSDGKFIVSGSSDRTVRLWDVDTGQCLKILQGHSDRVSSIAFSPDGLRIASGSSDRTVRLWDVDTGQALKALLGHTNRVSSIAFSPDGMLIVSGSEDQTVRLWDVDSGRCLKTLQGHSDRVSSVAFSPDSLHIVSGSEDQTIRLWDVDSGRCLKILQGHTDRVSSVAFSSDGMLIVSGSEDQAVDLWDVRTGQVLKTLVGYSDRVSSVAFSPDGKFIASGSEDQTVRLWDINSGRCLKILQGHTDRISSVTFSPEGKFIANGGSDRAVRLWDADSGRCLKILQGHSSRVSSVAFSPDGKFIASGSEDQTVRLWDADSGRCLKILQGHSDRISSVAFSPGGRFAASGSEDQTVRLWDVDRGQSLEIFLGHSDRVSSVAFSPDGKFIASGSEDQTVRLWDVDTGQTLKALLGHTNRVSSIAFSPDGMLIVSGSEDQTVRLWDVDSGRCLKILQGHSDRVTSIAFSPAGKFIASGSLDGTIKLWEFETAEWLKSLRSDRPYEGMNITNVRGLIATQKDKLKVLGAIEENIQAKEETKQKSSKSSITSQSLYSTEIFISCAHVEQDEEIMKALISQLNPLKLSNNTTIWSDLEAQLGTDKKEEIEKHLYTANIILLLVSPDFIQEMDESFQIRQIVNRNKAELVPVIPIIIRPTYGWEDTPFGGLTALPKNKKAVTSWPNRDEALREIAGGIRDALIRLREAKVSPQLPLIVLSDSSPYEVS